MVLAPKRKARLFKFLKITYLPYLPFRLNIETGNICNLRCPLCPTGIGDVSMKKGILSFKLFKHVADQLINNIQSINLYSWGEPLLNPGLINMILYVKKKNPSIKVLLAQT